MTKCVNSANGPKLSAFLVRVQGRVRRGPAGLPLPAGPADGGRRLGGGL